MWEKRQHTGSAGKIGRPYPETTPAMGHSLEMGLRLPEYIARFRAILFRNLCLTSRASCGIMSTTARGNPNRMHLFNFRYLPMHNAYRSPSGKSRSR